MKKLKRIIGDQKKKKKSNNYIVLYIRIYYKIY